MRFLTDKVTRGGYLPAYLRIAVQLGSAARVCEVGVDHGHGLDMFQALFPDGVIAGVDERADCRWPDGAARIVCRQDDPGLPGLLRQHGPRWDLIVDDASHDGKLTRATFDLLWPLTAPGGFYVVEDWTVGLPGAWPEYGSSMLETAQSFLLLLGQGSDLESVEYRGGMVILRKAE